MGKDVFTFGLNRQSFSITDGYAYDRSEENETDVSGRCNILAKLHFRLSKRFLSEGRDESIIEQGDPILTGFVSYLKITNEQRKYAKNLADKIYSDKRSAGDKGGNARKNPRKINRIGFLGETLYADYHNLERPKLIEGDTDKGYDFKKDGETVDVKTSKKYRGLIIFPDKVKDLAERLSRIYIKNKKIAEISLTVTLNEFIRKAETRDFGYGKRLFLQPNANFSGSVSQK